MQLREAQSSKDIEDVRELFAEYQTWLGINLCFQNFDREVAELPGDYAPPSGRLLIADEDGVVAGCIALRDLGADICEMKRLYVRPQFRGTGLGKQLVDRILEFARQTGYRRMRLDTLPGKMDQAIGMYERLGFRRIPAYYHNPVADAVFMEMVL